MATPNVANPNIEIAWDNFFQLKVNKKTWFLHNKMFFPWSIFVVNIGTKITHGTTQIMRCTICHCVSKVYNFNSNTKKRGLISYNKYYQNTPMKKHVNTKHPNVWSSWATTNVVLETKNSGCEKSN